MALPGKTEAGSAGKQPCRGIARRAHRDDDHGRGSHLSRSSQSPIGSIDPDALKIPARRAPSTLTRSAHSPVPAEPGQSGEIISQGRLREAIDPYYSSPVAADGHIYIVSLGGKISVLRAGPEIEVVATHDLGEDCYATPALAGQEIYVRTTESLFAFSRDRR